MTSLEKQNSQQELRQEDVLRPQFHFSPQSNWANDPNGMVYYQGEYHFFYQYHPDSMVWGPMHWGHAVSSDMVNWQYLPIALYPDEHGMIFSGSAVVDWENSAGFGKEALIIFYTASQVNPENQNLAYSTDRGRTWSKYPGNPVLPGPLGVRDFRDPKVLWYSENGAGHWVMCLAVGDAVRFYTSSDLKQWEFGGTFGFTYGSQAGVWETPDLFKLSVEGGSQTRWVLSVGVGSGGRGGLAGGSATQYFIGQFDGANFFSDNPPETTLWADYGADYYAAQSWSDAPDGRRLVLAWMNNWQYAVLVPASTWRGMFSLPRQLTLVATENGIRLINQPVPELRALRGKYIHLQDETLIPGQNILPGLEGDCLEIEAEFELNPGLTCFGFHLRVGLGHNTTVGYDTVSQELFVDRTRSGQTDFHKSFAGKHTVELAPQNETIRLHLFLDRSSVEVFGNDGLAVITDAIFPFSKDLGLDIFTESGKIKINYLDIFQLNPARFGALES